MKILFVTTHLNVGGISTYIVTLLKHLKKRGVDVVCASAGGTLVSELEKADITHYHIPVRTKNEVHIKLLFALFKIIEIIDKEEITHLHAHTRVTQVVALIAKKLRPVHYISTCHGFYKRRLSRRLFPAWGDRVIAIRDPVREHLVNAFKEHKSNIELVYNAVELEKFDRALTTVDKEELRRYYKVGAKGMVVGGISRLEKVKGYHYLINAIPTILEKHPDTQFVLIGEGKYKDSLLKLARKLHVEDRVTFTGKVEDVSVALELIDIFVHPCIWNEGFGIAVLEAMAAGKPIIASNLGGLYALVKEGVNGWLISSKDHIVLADSVNRLLTDTLLYKRMSENSYALARETFSMERMTSEIIKVYEDVM